MPTASKKSGVLTALAFVLGFRLLIISYWLARYGGNWAESDAARTTGTIISVFESGALAPAGRYLYLNGFLYQVLGAVLAQVTGLGVVDVQHWLMPLLGMALTFVAFIFYLRIFRSPTLAAIATTLLHLQGDFIYTTLRSSHEKVDFLLIFVSLLVLVLSVQWFESLRERLALAIVYYLVILAENTNNVFFASTFTVTLVLSFLLWYGLSRYAQRRLLSLRWIAAATGYALLLTIILVTFIYPTETIITSATLGLVLTKWLVIFFAVLAASLLTTFVLQGWHDRTTATSNARWLLYVSIVSMIFIFLVIFVWYAPARSVVNITGSITERIRLFMVSPVSAPGGLLEIVSNAWIFPQAWLWLRMYDILLVLGAAIGWVVLVRNLPRSASHPQAAAPINKGTFWLLVLLPAFVLQNVLFVLADLTGSVRDINNLQIRLIPFTALVAVPTATHALAQFLAWLRTRKTADRLAKIGLVAAAVLALILGLIKGTSEPLLANSWFFYTPAERAGVGWLNQSMPKFNFDTGRRAPLVWAGPDTRLGRVWQEQFWGSSRNALPLAYTLDAPYTYIFLSPGVRMLTERYSDPVPDLRDASLIYDNGGTQVYFRPPESQP